MIRNMTVFKVADAVCINMGVNQDLGSTLLQPGTLSQLHSVNDSNQIYREWSYHEILYLSYILSAICV